MENKNRATVGITVSILEGDELFHNRIISRESSVGVLSSRIYYRSRTDQGVPFKWEMEPGKPKYQPEDELIPPLSPPPGAMQSSGGRLPILIKPRSNQEHNMSSNSKPSVFWLLWKKIRKKSKQNKNLVQADAGSSGLEIMDRFELCSSDGKIITSSRDSSASSSSSLSSNAHSQSSRTQSPTRDFLDDDGPLISCTPWNYNPILYCVARRV